MHKFQKIVCSLLISIILLAFIGPATLSGVSGIVRAHPLLSQMAAQDPTRTVAVIVQKANETGAAEKLAAHFGGKITKDLSLIHAFVVELPVQATLELAKSPAVRWVSLDAPVTGSAGAQQDLPDAPPVPFTYPDTLGAVQARNELGLSGAGISVAIIDSGISIHKDLDVARRINFHDISTTVVDNYGHGTHIAGIIGGDGQRSGGSYVGIAPRARLISLKVSDQDGMAYESNVVEAMQWVYRHKDRFNIRVVNISTNSVVEQSYHTSPMDAAAEILWFNGVVVVVSGGNRSADGVDLTTAAAPANDPFLITVGATNENGTSDRADDVVASFSAGGLTLEGFAKPDILAPGYRIISTLSRHSVWDDLYPERVVDRFYFSLSGTSMAAPMVSGAVALLLQDEPWLTPDQVKYRLINTAATLPDGSKYLDIYAAVTGTTDQSTNTGTVASQLLWSGPEPVQWNSVSWNSVSWNSVSWNSVSWNSVSWNSNIFISVSWNE